MVTKFTSEVLRAALRRNGLWAVYATTGNPAEFVCRECIPLWYITRLAEDTMRRRRCAG